VEVSVQFDDLFKKAWEEEAVADYDTEGFVVLHLLFFGLVFFFLCYRVIGLQWKMKL